MKSKKEPNTKKVNKMAGITMYLSILILKVNGFSSPIKRNKLVNWIKKKDLIIFA
jgi:hypothetical protein